MKERICFLIFNILSASLCHAQLQTLDFNGAYGRVMYNDPVSIGQKKVNNINYSETRGEYFWDEDWSPGILVLKNGKGFKFGKVRLNLYTNEVHYLDNQSIELSVPVDLLKEMILFSPKDSISIIASFQVLNGLTKDNKGHCFQVLNDGKIQLLKYTSIIMRKNTYDPLRGEDEYTFSSSTDYYVRNVNSIKLLKDISKKSLASIENIPVPQLEEWTKSKIKREADVIEFFNFLNSK